MKELVFGGCSMVADYVSYRNEHTLYPVFNSDLKKYENAVWEQMKPFPTVANILADYYNLKCIDYSYPGSGNKRIYNQLADHVMQHPNQVEMVVACWTTFPRMDFETKSGYESLVYRTYKDTDLNKHSIQHKFYPLWKEMHDCGFVFEQKDINDFFRYSISLDSICKQREIKLVQCFSLMTSDYPENNISDFIMHPSLNEIDLENFYGFPGFHILNGKALANFRHDDKEKYYITKYDGHCSEQGHQEMANRLIGFIDG